MNSGLSAADIVFPDVHDEMRMVVNAATQRYHAAAERDGGLSDFLWRRYMTESRLLAFSSIAKSSLSPRVSIGAEFASFRDADRFSLNSRRFESFGFKCTIGRRSWLEYK